MMYVCLCWCMRVLLCPFVLFFSLFVYASVFVYFCLQCLIVLKHSKAREKHTFIFKSHCSHIEILCYEKPYV